MKKHDSILRANISTELLVRLGGSVFHNPPQHLDLAIHIMVDSVFLVLHFLALVLMLRAWLGPDTVQSKSGTFGALGSCFTATLFPLPARQTTHPGSFGDSAARSRTGFCQVTRTRSFWTAVVYRRTGILAASVHSGVPVFVKFLVSR